MRRTETDPSWNLGMKLVGVGRDDVVSPPPAATLSSNGNRITYDRGDLTEWYVNDAKGLEQGFTLVRRPEGRGDEPLRMKLELTGELTAGVNQSGLEVEFSTVGGVTLLHLSKLIAWDASERTLEARFEHVGSHLSLIVDDTEAIYPIVIDPLATSPSWTAESDQAGARFGSAVSTAGDVNGDGYADVIVGAYYFDNGEADEGRAYVYHGSSTGLATVPSWTAEGDQESAWFGISVSTAGDVNGDGYSDVIVGAKRYDNGETNEGRAYVYHGSPAGLAMTEAWTAESDQFDASFGESVSSAADVNGDGYADVIVGAPSYDSPSNNEGRAFVYHGSSTGLSMSEAWTAESDQTLTYFGIPVSMAGDVNGDGYADVIVNAWGYGVGGAAFVYRGASAGVTANPTWTAEPNQGGARFGTSVSMAGDVNGDGYADVIVGAYS